MRHIVFGCDRRPAADLESALEAEVERRLQVGTDFFVRTAEEWRDALIGSLETA